MSIDTQRIKQIILTHFPQAQAIYLFGSSGTGDERPDSDVDIAVLLPPETAKAVLALTLSDLHIELADALGRDVDLINLRQVPTVLQKEITTADRQIFCADAYATAEFEMLVLSYYQKLNEERREILEAFERTGRAYAV